MNRALYLLILSCLAIQVFVHYFGQVLPGLRWGSFFYATAAARIVIPSLLLLGFLRIPLGRLGFGRPRLSKRDGVALAALLLAGTAAALFFLQQQGYQSAYRGLRGGDPWLQFQRWALFTLSATVPWELFHRGFLLHGTREICTRHGVSQQAAASIAILFTACFEVLFHLSKPLEESLGMLVGSPILSAMAFRFHALWIPALIHLWIELLWFLMVWI